MFKKIYNLFSSDEKFKAKFKIGDTVKNYDTKKKGFVTGRDDLLSLKRYHTSYTIILPDDEPSLISVRLLLAEKIKNA